MRFNYKAQTKDKQISTGTIEAADRFGVARILREKGQEVITVMPVGTGRSWASWFSLPVSMRERILFATNLSAMLSAGLPLARALRVLSRQPSSRQFKEVVESVALSIDSGSLLSKALNDFPNAFSPIFVAMVKAAESSGTVPQTLLTLGEQLQKSYDLKRKIKGAMIYPAIIVLLIITIGILMMIFVIPTLITTFSELNVELPLSTKIVIGISSLIINHYLWLIFAVALVLLIIFSALETKSGRRLFYSTLLRLPIIGNLSREANAALIMRTIASLLSAGVSMVEAVEIAGTVSQNVLYQEALAEAADKIQKGFNLSAIFAARPYLYLPLVPELTEVGEETGALASMLTRGAVFFETEVDQAVKNISTVIEPLLMVVVGVAVGFFALALLSPIYSLTDAF